MVSFYVAQRKAGGHRAFAASRSNARLGRISLERNTIVAFLALWTFSLKHVSAIGPINVTTVWFETFHTISELTVVCAPYSTMTVTPLVIAINKTNFSRIRIATHEIFHALTYMPNVKQSSCDGAQQTAFTICQPVGLRLTIPRFPAIAFRSSTR